MNALLENTEFIDQCQTSVPSSSINLKIYLLLFIMVTFKIAGGKCDERLVRQNFRRSSTKFRWLNKLINSERNTRRIVIISLLNENHSIIFFFRYINTFLSCLLNII